MKDKIKKALEYATEMHKNQTRKDSNLPYISHPIKVAEICSIFTNSVNVQIGALLHDVVEDCDCTLNDIKHHFGDEIYIIVKYCTAISKHSDGNRKKRKIIDKNHYLCGNNESKIIKVADAIHNCHDMSNSFKLCDFFKNVYLDEKIKLINSMVETASYGTSLYLICNAFIKMANNYLQYGKFELEEINL
jgi:(p)ppGpp synthase/HD superfamily hydrolase